MNNHTAVRSCEYFMQVVFNFLTERRNEHEVKSHIGVVPFKRHLQENNSKLSRSFPITLDHRFMINFSFWRAAMSQRNTYICAHLCNTADSQFMVNIYERKNKTLPCC